jgi:hypothetical protein
VRYQCCFLFSFFYKVTHHFRKEMSSLLPFSIFLSKGGARLVRSEPYRLLTLTVMPRMIERPTDRSSSSSNGETHVTPRGARSPNQCFPHLTLFHQGGTDMEAVRGQLGMGVMHHAGSLNSWLAAGYYVRSRTSLRTNLSTSENNDVDRHRLGLGRPCK